MIDFKKDIIEAQKGYKEAFKKVYADLKSGKFKNWKFRQETGGISSLREECSMLFSDGGISMIVYPKEPYWILMQKLHPIWEDQEISPRKKIEEMEKVYIEYVAGEIKSAENNAIEEEIVADTETSSSDKSPFSHSPDYRSVSLRGKTFSLTPRQAQIIEMLYNAHKKGTPELGQHYILEELESQASRLRDAFRSRPEAWDALIMKGKTKGTYRLNI